MQGNAAQQRTLECKWKRGGGERALTAGSTLAAAKLGKGGTQTKLLKGEEEEEKKKRPSI